MQAPVLAVPPPAKEPDDFRLREVGMQVTEEVDVWRDEDVEGLDTVEADVASHIGVFLHNRSDIFNVLG